MAIHFLTADISFTPDNPRKIRKWLTTVIETEEKFTGCLSFVFTSDDYLRALNIQYLNKDYYTDVISFDYTEGLTVNGDILVSVERVRENAGIYNVDFYDELHRVLLHGILHLLGYSDSTESERVMIRHKEDQYLSLR